MRDSIPMDSIDQNLSNAHSSSLVDVIVCMRLTMVSLGVAVDSLRGPDNKYPIFDSTAVGPFPRTCELAQSPNNDLLQLILTSQSSHQMLLDERVEVL